MSRLFNNMAQNRPSSLFNGEEVIPVTGYVGCDYCEESAKYTVNFIENGKVDDSVVVCNDCYGQYVLNDATVVE